jgi:integrase
MPSKERGWKESVRAWDRWRRETAKCAKGTHKEYRRAMYYFPAHFRAAGIDPPSAPSKVTRAMVRALWESEHWASTTRAIQLAVLRQFMRWSGNKVASEKEEWRHATPVPTHRRWLTAEQEIALWNAAQGTERWLLAPEIFLGARRQDVLNLRVRDVNFEAMTVRLHSKRKERKLKISDPRLYAALREACAGKKAADPVYGLAGMKESWQRNKANRDLYRASRRAGLGVVGHHDPRRSWSRIAIRGGAKPAYVRDVMGHSSVDMTLHYAGIDEDNQQEALDVFENALANAAEPPKVMAVRISSVPPLT